MECRRSGRRLATGRWVIHQPQLSFLSYGTTCSDCFAATSGNSRPGGFAEYAILEQDLAIRIPSAVSMEDAATFPLCSLTAAQVTD